MGVLLTSRGGGEGEGRERGRSGGGRRRVTERPRLGVGDTLRGEWEGEAGAGA